MVLVKQESFTNSNTNFIIKERRNMKKIILIIAAVIFFAACSERSNNILEPSESESETLDGIYSRVLLSDYETIILYYSGAYISSNIEDFFIYPDGQNWEVYNCESLRIEAGILYIESDQDYGLTVELENWPHISAAR
jgi:hypothetical protein